MKALSDGNRAKIIKMLEIKEMCVCEMQVVLKVAQPSVSKHLKILEEAGLVESRKDGMWVNYRLSDGHESSYAAGMIRQLEEWLNDDSVIREVLAQLPNVDRVKINAA